MAFRGYHGDYSDKAVHGNDYNKIDRHYALYTPEHLRNFFEAAGIKPIKTKLIFWKSVKSRKSRFLHWITKVILGERYAMPSVYAVGRKD